MVSFFAGVCEICGEPNKLATPDECKRAGLDVDASVCVECVGSVSAADLDRDPKPQRDQHKN